MRHTPGPWRLIADTWHYDSLSIVVGGKESVEKRIPAQLVVHVGGWAGILEQEANARAIAAVPDMIHALLEIVKHERDQDGAATAALVKAGIIIGD